MPGFLCLNRAYLDTVVAYLSVKSWRTDGRRGRRINDKAACRPPPALSVYYSLLFTSCTSALHWTTSTRN